MQKSSKRWEKGQLFPGRVNRATNLSILINLLALRQAKKEEDKKIGEYLRRLVRPWRADTSPV